jgi:hypothetical protein
MIDGTNPDSILLECSGNKAVSRPRKGKYSSILVMVLGQSVALARVVLFVENAVYYAAVSPAQCRILCNGTSDNSIY